jgi:hypothetical protein
MSSEKRHVLHTGIPEPVKTNRMPCSLQTPFTILPDYLCEFPWCLCAAQIRHIVIVLTFRGAPPRRWRHRPQSDTILLAWWLISRRRVSRVHASTSSTGRWRLAPGLSVTIRFRTSTKRTTTHSAVLGHPASANCCRKDGEDDEDHKTCKNHAVSAVHRKRKATISLWSAIDML